MKRPRLTIKILTTLIRDRMHYPNRLVFDTISIVARCGLLLILYQSVFRLNGGTINGTTFAFVAWSMFFYFSFSVLCLREISRAIMLDVQTGNIELLFTKPVSYLAYRMWWQVGSGLYSFLLITTVATCALALAIGFPPTMQTGMFIPTLLLTLVLGALLALCIYTMVGLLAFWIEDINPIYWVVDKAIMILGGSYLPVALFPPLMYGIARYSPFGASQFVSHTVYASWQTAWPLMVGVQATWIVVLSACMYGMFVLARRKVSINGG